MNRKPRGRPPDPDDDWNEEELSVTEGTQLCKEIYDEIEDAPSEIWDSAFDFFESIQEKVSSMSESITKYNKFTQKQKDALLNMQAGVKKWTEKDD